MRVPRSCPGGKFLTGLRVGGFLFRMIFWKGFLDTGFFRGRLFLWKRFFMLNRESFCMVFK